ncbi:MAG: pimeloyl-ACP methyl ester carboxylesterase [Paracoccaceae bacterium]|jgi:pimeloyl-ACP methyl ester carboxylesterase
MTHFVLVHGAWEGAWSWDKIQPTLEQNGNKVTAIDLPGSPGNQQPLAQVTLDNYVQTVAGAISALDHRVVLVGHSLAGAIISNVAEAIPDKIERLVYVTAFLLENGDSIWNAMPRDPGGEFLPELIFAEDQSHASASEATWRSKAFHDVTEADIQNALPRVNGLAQATQPFLATVSVSEARFGTVSKTYIRTSIDKMVSPALQDEMLAATKVDTVHTLVSGHFPTLSVPSELADLILKSALVPA